MSTGNWSTGQGAMFESIYLIKPASSILSKFVSNLESLGIWEKSKIASKNMKEAKKLVNLDPKRSDRKTISKTNEINPSNIDNLDHERIGETSPKITNKLACRFPKPPVIKVRVVIINKVVMDYYKLK